MSETIFDLSMHGIDEAPGKSLIVNRVRYLIHDLADEGGETFIFPLENQKSGLVMFLAKIFKFSPTSPEFEKRKRTAYNGFILSLIGIPTIREEQYEIAGGLMKFQLHQEGGMFMGAGYMRQETPMPRT